MTIEERILTLEARCRVLEVGILAAATAFAGEPGSPDRRFVASLERFADHAEANGQTRDGRLMRALIDDLRKLLG